MQFSVLLFRFLELLYYISRFLAYLRSAIGVWYLLTVPLNEGIDRLLDEFSRFWGSLADLQKPMLFKHCPKAAKMSNLCPKASQMDSKKGKKTC